MAKSNLSLIEVANNIAEQAKILDVVQHFSTSPIKKNGSNYQMKCPFHEDNLPSLTISPSKNICKCFACNTPAMNPIGFVQRFLHLTFVEAMQKVATFINFDLKQFNFKKNKKMSPLGEKICKLHAYFLNLAANNLMQELQNSHVNATVKGICKWLTPELQKKLKLGFLSDAYWPSNAALLNNKSISKETLIASKLVNNVNNLKYSFCFFNKRLIFPIIDRNNNVLGFVGRSTSDKLQPKYLNSPETEVYKKSNAIYNIQNLHFQNQQNNAIYIVEGPKDVFALNLIGIPNVVGLLGTNLSATQLKMLSNYSKKLIFVPDQDGPGFHAALKNAVFAIKHNFQVQFIFQFSKKDAFDVLEHHGKNELKLQIKNVISIYDYLNLIYLNNVNDFKLDEKILCLRNILNNLVFFNDPVENVALEIYFASLSEKLNIDIKTINKIFLTIKNNNNEIKKYVYVEEHLQNHNLLNSSNNDQKIQNTDLLHLLIIQLLYSHKALTFLTGDVLSAIESLNLIEYKLINCILDFYNINNDDLIRIPKIYDNKFLGNFFNYIALRNHNEILENEKEGIQILVSKLTDIMNKNQLQSKKLSAAYNKPILFPESDFNKSYFLSICQKILGCCAKDKLKHLNNELLNVKDQNQKNLIIEEIKKTQFVLTQTKVS